MQSKDIEIFVNKGTVRPIVFSIPTFLEHTGNDSSILLSNQVRDIVINDLINSGMFTLNQNNTKDAEQLMEENTVEFMRTNNVKIAVGCKMEREGSDFVQITVRIMHDIGEKPEILKVFFKGSTKNIRLLAHQIANAIYQVAWSIPGDFDSQIVYINKIPDRNALMIMDRDGENVKKLDAGKIILTPNVSKDGRYIAYAKYVGNYSCLFVYDRRTNEVRQVTPHGMICCAPVFSNDGNYLVFSYSNHGRTSLYKMALNNIEKRTAITKSKGWIDTTPAFTASGENMIIVSDRGSGIPALHIYSFLTDSVYKIKTGKGSYYDPTCCTNPFNGQITQVGFFKRHAGMAFLGMLLLDKDFNVMQEKLLWTGPRIFAPSWGVNGTSIVFATAKKIHRINVFTGMNEQLNLPGSAASPVVSVRPYFEQNIETSIV